MPNELKYRCHQCRKPAPKNNKEAVERLREWLDKGEAWAQELMAEWYRDGTFGLKQSFVMARMLFEKAVAQGDPSATCNLACLYREGRGVDQSFTKAVELYTTAAEKRVANAMAFLGALYHNGQGVVQSYTKAAENYTMAAEQGHGDAMVNLGVMYIRGQGVGQSNELARDWWIKAANKGQKTAIEFLKKLDKQEGKSTTTASTSAASPPTDPPVCCSACNTPQPSGQTFSKCTGCRTVQYCNKECQRGHWSPGGHKQVCKRLKKKREEKKGSNSSSRSQNKKSK
jgi:TPR repeat protein